MEEKQNHNPNVEELIRVIRAEHRSTRRVFGLSIIVLAVVLMFIAPEVITLEREQRSMQPAVTVPAPEGSTSQEMAQ